MITASQLKIGQSVSWEKAVYIFDSKYTPNEGYYTGVVKDIHGNIVMLEETGTRFKVISTIEMVSFHERRKSERRQE